jgi:hypothetical protein
LVLIIISDDGRDCWCNHKTGTLLVSGYHRPAHGPAAETAPRPCCQRQQGEELPPALQAGPMMRSQGLGTAASIAKREGTGKVELAL